MNKIEQFKAEKDGLDIVGDVPRLAQDGWEAIGEGDRERLKWAGVFFRRQTPGRFMMRVRIPNGFTNADQIRALAGITRDYGVGYADITTRQQIQLRGFEIGHVPDIWRRLHDVGLVGVESGSGHARQPRWRGVSYRRRAVAGVPATPDRRRADSGGLIA